MLHYDFEASPGYWIFATAHALQNRLNEELAEHGITLRQWEVLVWLSYLGESSQSELAQCMRIEAPTLVGVLDRMERDGWIERETAPSDRRRKRIRPTERVEPVWSKMVACARRVRAEAIAGIDEKKLNVMREVLETMRANLAAATGPDPEVAAAERTPDLPGRNTNAAAEQPTG